MTSPLLLGLLYNAGGMRCLWDFFFFKKEVIDTHLLII